MLRGFPMSDMPQAFRDAANVCRGLDVDLLWIDALCIIQDLAGQSDWQRELLQMDKIYSNALLNISAVAAADGGRSFFVHRDPAIIPELIVSTAIGGGEKKPYRVRNLNFWRCEVEKGDLNLRGWVFQERLLAQRVLRYGRAQVSWECANGSAAESFPDGVPAALLESTSGISSNFVQKLQHAHNEAGQSGRRRIYLVWDTVIESYSRCSLTRPGDRLAALAGVAKVFASLANTQYVAGMWREDLEVGLPWRLHHYAHDADRLPRRIEVYTAPSWSWASIDGCVSAWYPELRTEIWAILDVTLNLTSEDKMSLIRNARLLLRCDMARVTVSEESKTGPFSRESISSDVENADETIVVWVYWDMPKKSIGMAGRDAYVASAGFREEVDGAQGYGLLLRRVEDGEQAGTYARCAYYQTSPLPGEGRKTVELLREAFKETAEIPCVRCEGAQRVIWVV